MTLWTSIVYLGSMKHLTHQNDAFGTKCTFVDMLREMETETNWETNGKLALGEELWQLWPSHGSGRNMRCWGHGQKQRVNPECLIYLPWEQLRLLLQGTYDTVSWQSEHCMIHQALNERLKKILKRSWISTALPYHVLVRNDQSRLLQKVSFTPSWSKPAAVGSW